jgi:glycosyltransferase involved in cell wall biosynthesis
MLNRNRFQPFFLFPNRGPILAELDARSIEYEIWGKEHEPEGLLSYVSEVSRAMRLFRVRRVDVLHVNHGAYWRPAEVLAARLLRIPIVTHYRTIIEKAGPFHHFSSAIIANSKYTAENSDTAGVPVNVIYNIVDIDRFSSGKSIREEFGISPNDVVVAFLGQIKRIKGIEMFLELARRIRDPGVSFLMAGALKDKAGDEGAYTKESLERAIGDMMHVHYLGYRTDAENLYFSANIIVMPSQWEEPFGLINLEAGAAGKPVIATRVGGIPETIQDGENGFLVERTDIDGMERCLRRLIEDPALRGRMGERGRAIIESKFQYDPPRLIEALYDQIIAARAG